jgi:hypothetical protein
MAEPSEQRKLAGYGEWETFKVPPIGESPTALLPSRLNRTESYIRNVSQDTIDEESSRSDYDCQVPITANSVLADLETLAAGTWQISASIHVSGKVKPSDEYNVALVVDDVVAKRYFYQPGVIAAESAYTLVIPQKAVVHLRTVRMASGKAVYRTTLTATRTPTLTGSRPVMLSDKEQPLKTMVPTGFILLPGKSLRMTSRQPMYAIALTDEATVSVLDQW